MIPLHRSAFEAFAAPRTRRVYDTPQVVVRTSRLAFLGRLFAREHADDLAVRDRLARRNGKLRDRPAPVGVDLVLHLHRLDDAEHLAGGDLVALGDRHHEHRPLHRGDDGVVTARPAAHRAHAFAPAPSERAPRGLGLGEPYLKAPPVDLDRADVVDRPRRSA